MFVFDEVLSTQDKTFEILEADKALDHAWVFAHKQTQGRGRQGRVWESSSDVQNPMCVSVGIRLDVNSEKLMGFASLLAGYAMLETFRALHNDLDNKIYLKWPNDLVVLRGDMEFKNFKKLGGILCEKKSNFLIIGWGANVSIAPESIGHAIGLADLDICNLKSLDLAKKLSENFWTLWTSYLKQPQMIAEKIIESLNEDGMKPLWGQIATYCAVIDGDAAKAQRFKALGLQPSTGHIYGQLEVTPGNWQAQSIHSGELKFSY